MCLQTHTYNTQCNMFMHRCVLRTTLSMHLYCKLFEICSDVGILRQSKLSLNQTPLDQNFKWKPRRFFMHLNVLQTKKNVKIISKWLPIRYRSTNCYIFKLNITNGAKEIISLINCFDNLLNLGWIPLFQTISICEHIKFAMALQTMQF